MRVIANLFAVFWRWRSSYRYVCLVWHWASDRYLRAAADDLRTKTYFKELTMTHELNLEQERREFEADFKTEFGIDVGRVFGEAYASSRVEDRWGGWLAAKRAAMGSGEKVAKGLYAIRYRDNWDGEGNIYHLIAQRHEDGSWTDDESGKKLLEYKGDEILRAWSLDENAPPAPVIPPEETKGDITGWLRRRASNDLVMIPGRLASEIADHIDKLAAPVSAEPVATTQRVKDLIGKLDEWRYRMSYNDSYFGEPEGFLKKTVRELAKAADATPAAQPAPVSAELMGANDQAEEDAAVIQKLGTILAEVCLVLKGEELALHRHSYHDIVDVAQAIKLELDLYRAQADNAPPAAAKDAERLDWLIASNAVVNAFTSHVGKKYRIAWMNTSDCQADWFDTPRAAIDAAREAK